MPDWAGIVGLPYSRSGVQILNATYDWTAGMQLKTSASINSSGMKAMVNWVEQYVDELSDLQVVPDDPRRPQRPAQTSAATRYTNAPKYTQFD